MTQWKQMPSRFTRPTQAEPAQGSLHAEHTHRSILPVARTTVPPLQSNLNKLPLEAKQSVLCMQVLAGVRTESCTVLVSPWLAD